MQLNFANTTLFEINTEAEVKVEEIGQWKSRVITVDNVFRHPEEMRDWCTTHPLERSSQTFCLTVNYRNVPRKPLRINAKLIC